MSEIRPGACLDPTGGTLDRHRAVRTIELLAEHGLIPQPLVRAGIRHLIADRLRSEARLDQAARRIALLAAMRAGPIALHVADANVQHYEVPVEFFRSVLGPRLKYSCALWERGTTTLAAAEEAMLRLTCERAAIVDGMRVLDLGCGWGSLTRWILEHYPHCHVTAMSNSASQAEAIRADLTNRGLADRVTLHTADVNTFHPDSRFDRICSIEMLEHMRNYEVLLARIAGWLEPGGRCFIHIFCHRRLAYPYEIDGDGDWMARNFFTGGLMPSQDLLAEFQRDLLVEDSWRVPGEHYARTSEAWLANLDRDRDAVMRVLAHTYGRQAAGRWLHRWRLFFLACTELFAYGGGTQWFVGHYRLRARTAG